MTVAGPRKSGTAVSQTRNTGMVAFVAGSLVYQAGRLALSLLAARVLGPESFGDWVLLTLLIVYLSAAGLGVTNGAGREIPFLAGAGRNLEAKRIGDVAAGTTLLSGLAAAILAALLAAVLVSRAGSAATLGLVAVAAALQHPFLLEQVLFRSWFAFGKAAVQLAALGAAVMLSGVALLRFGIQGLLVSQIVTYVIAITLGLWLLPHVPRPRWDLAAVKPLMSVGFPIMLAGLMYGFLTTVDRWLVAVFLDRADVGHYGLVGIVVSGLLLVPQLLSQQFYPLMSFAFGEGRTAADLLRLARRQGLIAGTIVGVIGASTAAAAFVLIPIALPEYRASLIPLVIALVGVIAYAFASGYGNFLNTVGAHRRFLGIQTVAVVANIALAAGLLWLGYGLPAVAAASASGMALYTMMVYRTASATATDLS